MRSIVLNWSYSQDDRQRAISEVARYALGEGVVEQRVISTWLNEGSLKGQMISI